jgi:hypothetical protein
MKLYKSIVISIVILVLSSCSSATGLVEKAAILTPDIGVDIQEGKYLAIIAPEGWNSFRTDDYISLDIQNISESQITSDPDFGARMFIRTDKGWVEVKNEMTYKNKPFSLDPLKMAGTIVYPELPDYSIPYDIRIFIVGELVENGNEARKVGSYIDLKLSP